MSFLRDTYAENMQRDSTEGQRLDEQFHLLTENIGYLLHPSVRVKMHPQARVADIATGTAAFLRNLAPNWPDAILHGYDISTALYPPSRTLPSNVSLHILDARRDVPVSLWGQYDIVHVRLIAAGLAASEWGRIIRNLAKLLKPGGAMQWEECNFTNVRHLPGRPDSTIGAATTIGCMFLTAMRPRFEHGWNRLAAEMRNAGLTDVHTEAVSADRVYDTRPRLTANGMRAMFGWARLHAARGSPGALTMRQIDDLEQKAYTDIQSGCYVTFDIHVAWGFRPE
ncbi:hypothetical protein E8E15_007179 [Penicillium rubens]|uniref:Pc22g22620 protein n=2 Tax=Penicillium chrysogenum species complex TaxID=254878 RepID=B6HUN4_PENRW|nr:uncharacterized protein N7525_004122 [Penicillium rubens]KZN90442.1 hypothetical protein EN45_005590 [Penicillium chrysogenum]CAP99550.1 Pc22g22620 [Penicillium rubens Wisconsin 54-1255]KAF3018031.1 hypothetical protein E8E15_007179 [Penicillium rubens]KAJ5045075.1 hypothetical protein NUH16_001887 [Penicillium rubens]KAJ5838934.1 hypothetical protein N7525_004122 [Penicillium rubens]